MIESAMEPCLASVIADAPPVGGYFSIVKIVVMLVLVTPWLAVGPWVHRDVERVRGPKLAWCSAVLASGTVGLLIWLLLPTYMVGLLIYLVLTLSTLIAYVVYRNQRVDERHRVLTGEHLSRILSLGTAGKRGKVEVLNRVRLYSAHGTVVQAPNPEKSEPAVIATHNVAQETLHDMFWRRASEADITPVGGEARVRMVIDGVVSDRPSMLTADSESLIQYLKGVADMDVDDVRRPQKGRISVELPGRDPCEITLATAGTTNGQRMRMRITEKVIRTHLDDLGMDGGMLARVRAMCGEGRGLIIASGLSGSGVTSTLYSLLRAQDPYIKLLMTVESRAEVDLENITQHEYGEPANVARALASALRRDPDAIMVDQCQDREAAGIICEAAAGKLILLGVTASDSFIALAKWVKTCRGDPSALDNLRGILCQVLLRQLCDNCREAYHPDPQMLAKANLPAGNIDVFYRPPTRPLTDEKGKPIICPNCQGSGYVGRFATFELLEVTDDVRKAAVSGASLSQIKAICRKRKMLYLQEQALRKVIEGATSVQEIVRVTQQKKKRQAGNRRA
jgi:general secretion pathway protein E